jgi:hypothetical protein
MRALNPAITFSLGFFWHVYLTSDTPEYMSLVDYSTRLLRLSSNNKTDPNDSNTNFSVSLGNWGSMLGDKLQGISIEGVSFPNYALNVPDDHNTLSFSLTGNSAFPNPDIIITISIPTGFYTDAQLAAALNEAFWPFAGTPLMDYAHSTNRFTWAVVPSSALDVNYHNLTLTLPVTDMGDNWQTGIPRSSISFLPSAAALNQPIGIISNSVDGSYTLILHTSPATVDAEFRTNLQGPCQLFLHSTKLTQGKLGLSAQNAIGSIGGLVNTFTAIGSIPMQGVPFATQVVYQPIGDFRPWFAWHRASHLDLSYLDISLRDHHGGVVDIGAGELNVVLRLWYNNHL